MPRRALIALLVALTLSVAPGPIWGEPKVGGQSLLERELTGIVEGGKSSVVAIRSMRTVPGHPDLHACCEGSGVLLEGGLIATTLSVAGPEDEITVSYSDGSVSRAQVANVDPLREIVLLRPDRHAGRELPLGSPDSLHAGSWVFLLGFSFSSPEASLSSGRFSSRTILSPSESPPDTIEILQLEANVFPGNSGAAVLNANGRFVGMILGGLGQDGYLDPVVLSSFGDELPLTRRILTAEPPLGIGFAVPADEIAALAQATVDGNTDEQGFLGVRVDTQLERRRGTATGVRVEDVVPGSPAALAGVGRGDYIVRIDDVPVPDSQALAALVRDHSPGTRMHLELVSGTGVRRTTQVVLGDYASDYRMMVVRHRILSGRANHLSQAREKLLDRLRAVDEELNRVRSLAKADVPQPPSP